MAAQFIPPVDPRAVKSSEVREVLRAALQPYVKKNLDSATDVVFSSIEKFLRLPSAPTKGATVMTEEATARPVRPQNL